jgi:arginine deiminase
MRGEIPPSPGEQITFSIPYGCDELGRLESVLLHTPGKALELINEENYSDWLFDRVPDIPRFAEEHRKYRELLIAHGVKVYELSDYIYQQSHLMDSMPNLMYLHDIAVISSRGTILSSMAWKGRKREELVVKEALTNLGIPTLIEFDEGDAFEGCLLLSKETLLVADTERHNDSAIRKFIRSALRSFKEVIYVDVPQERRYMHPDTIFNRIRPDLALTYLPAFNETYLFRPGKVRKINFADFMKRKGVELVNVSDAEQRRLACSFVPLESGVIFHYDTALEEETLKLLSEKGVEFILFHPNALTAGGGSLRCITLRLRREEGKK